MTAEELKKKGGLYFERIQEGWAKYDWEKRYMSQSMAVTYFRELMEKNGPENSFVDCYYHFLEEDSRKKIREALSSREAEYLDRLSETAEDLIFPLDEELLEIGTKLNEKEMLFFTFYFTRFPCTVWGNYKQEYICFRERVSGEKEEL